MSPHPDNFNSLDILQDLVDQAVLKIDAARVSAGKISS
jgi:hypothetical protein